MKTQAYIMTAMTAAMMLLVLFATGCTTPSDITMRTGLQTNLKESVAEETEPFIGQIKARAVKRSPRQRNWYFWGDAARSSAAQHVWREQYSAPIRYKDQSEPVGLIELKF